MKLVSVILPVYNNAAYLSACLDSVLLQSYTELEILLIDDGSDDSSGQICDRYAERDKRIRVFHKKNGGVSAARNLGIQLSKGYYLYFCDSDDLLHKDIIKTLVEMQTGQPDSFPMCSFLSFHTESEIEIKEADKQNILCYEDRDRVFEYLSHEGHLVTKLFYADLVKAKGIMFNEEITILEDQLFVYQYGHLMTGLRICPVKLYYYRDNPASALHTHNGKNAITSLKARYFIFRLSEEYCLGHDITEKFWNDATLVMLNRKKDIFLRRITVSPENRNTLRAIENALLNERYRKRNWRVKDYLYYLFLK